MGLRSSRLHLARGRGRPRTASAYLFKTYLKPGYVVFSTLSEIGSHPGFFHLIVFHQDRKTRVIDVNLTGQPAERAAWIASAFEFFGNTTEGKFCGWDRWLQSEVVPIVRRTTPLMREARDKWREKWEMYEADQA